ncbi:probable sulfate transporter 3.5 [Tanacetum coccineum]
MANVVMSFCMMLTLLFLAPVFKYTPLVALSAIIMSAMLGLIEYDKAYHLYKTDKFIDFVICMLLSFVLPSLDGMFGPYVGLALLRALLILRWVRDEKANKILRRMIVELTPQLYESAGGLPRLKLPLHSCSLARSMSAMEVSIPIASVLLGREHECNESFNMGRPPTLS